MTFEKVLITGGAGRLGTHVVDRIAGKCDLTVLDVKPLEGPHAGGTRQINASITDYAAMRAAFSGQEAVIHLAAIPNPRTAPADVTFNTNVQGAWAVLQAAEDAGVKRVVVASSDSVFGLSYNPPDWPPRYLPVDEEHPVRPTEFYSLSKQVTETISQSYAHRRKLEVQVIRPVHIVFPPEYPELEARGSDVQNYHFWTYVSPQDVAQGFDLALGSAYRGYELFVISAADGLNPRPTLQMAKERWGTLPEIRRPEVFSRNPYASVIDITKARDRLGYEPTSNWREMAATLRGA
ncbi:MAG: NAD(P)-dependent oxidoreductase [Hyphomicrobiaceae bacterium]|nr:NAD(P)-dependent oxidoreductase [Hyphomicrobiaceae bacterium]